VDPVSAMAVVGVGMLVVGVGGPSADRVLLTRILLLLFAELGSHRSYSSGGLVRLALAGFSRRLLGFGTGG
jgi:hypothetical protein